MRGDSIGARVLFLVEQAIEELMLKNIGRPLSVLASWLGGWSRLLLLVVAVIGVVGGLLWERQRHPPVPPGAEQVSTQLNAGVRQTSYRYPGAIAELRDFYRQALPQRGWRYCGTQATENCSNLINLVGRADEEIDVYRRENDSNNSGATIEIWPIPDPNERVFVTVFETSGQ